MNSSQRTESDSAFNLDPADYEDKIQLADSVWLYRNRKLTKHGNVFEGEIISGIYGIRPCAIKYARRNEQNIREARILSKLGHHTHVISIIQSGIEPGVTQDRVYIALEKCHRFNLRHLVEHKATNFGKFDQKWGFNICSQLVTGMTFVHENLVVHKDLKPSNILLTDDLFTIKIADFGSSQEVKSKDSMAYCACAFGTSGYRPPEGFGGSFISLKSDIFSLAILFSFVLSFGKSPFGDETHVWDYNIKHCVVNMPNIFVTNEQTVGHLLSMMLQKDRLRRPTIEQVSSHPCWTGEETECNFDYGVSDEVLDSDDVTSSIDVSTEDSDSDIEITSDFLSAVESLAMSKKSDAKPWIVVFDHRSRTLNRFNPRDGVLHKMQPYVDGMKYDFSTAVVKDFIYVFKQRSVFRIKYRDVTAIWEKMAESIQDHGWYPPVATVSGRIIAVGGSGNTFSKSTSQFIPSINEWKKLKDKQLGTQHAAVTSSQGYVYCIGGELENYRIATGSVERYDIATQVWDDEIPPMQIARVDAASVQVSGYLYVLGGWNQEGVLNSAEKLDIATNQWSIIASMNARRGNFRCHCIDDVIYAVGGDVEETVEKFDKKAWAFVKTDGPKMRLWLSVLVNFPKNF